MEPRFIVRDADTNLFYAAWVDPQPTLPRRNIVRFGEGIPMRRLQHAGTQFLDSVVLDSEAVPAQRLQGFVDGAIPIARQLRAEFFTVDVKVLPIRNYFAMIVDGPKAKVEYKVSAFAHMYRAREAHEYARLTLVPAAPASLRLV